MTDVVPKLTALLRTDRPDLSAWRAERSRLLRERRAATPNSLVSKSFQELTGLPQTTDGYAENSVHYHKFLAAVNAALGGEQPSDEVASAASAAFRVLQAMPALPSDGSSSEGANANTGRAPPGRAPPGLGSNAQLSRQAMQQARMLLTAQPAVVKSLPAPVASAAASTSAAFGRILADEQLQQMVAAHAPLSAWLRANRKILSSARGPDMLTNGAEEVDGTGSVMSVVQSAVLEKYCRLIGDDRASAPGRIATWKEPSGASAHVARGKKGSAVVRPVGEPTAAGFPESHPEGSLGWVRSICRKHLLSEEMGETEVDMLASMLLGQLQSSSSDEQLQEDLLSVLGFSAIEVVAEVLPRRPEVVGAIHRLLASYEHVAADGHHGGLGGGLGPPVTGASAASQIGCSVSMTSASQQRQEKQRRKEAAKVAKEKRRAALEETRTLQEITEEMSWLAAAGFEPAQDAFRKREQAMAPPETKDSTLAALRAASSIGGIAKALPDGTVRKSYTGWEEVCVPATPSTNRAAQRLVPVSELPEYAQLAFKGVKSLNALQSAVVDTALYSNENMLVCAPTGAGKTNVALLSIMQQVGMAIDGGVLDREKLKIIYIAPMKALAQELVGKFSKSLQPLSLQVREYTGDMQLTKREISATNVIITTPEKWDVVTRKGSDALVSAVGLLIIDEVHLLNDDRGPVIEAIVARTLRLVESAQQMIRIVGLSATLPNYADVALFLGANPTTGLFHFGQAYRPVPLQQTFIGVSKSNVTERNKLMTQIAYDKAVAAIRRGKQVMVFVHARNDTVRTARSLIDLAKELNQAEEFLPNFDEHPRYQLVSKEVAKSRSSEVKELFANGFGIHHAGMLRADRSLSERLFADGLINVLVCTATLAWGVNLPAHTVIIKGTQLYNPEKGTFVDVGVLDVQQIFGRAGRPQYDTDGGEGIIITQHGKLAHYLQMLTHSLPIESQFVSRLCDHLNAEIALGTVTSVREAVTWLSYTYLYVRMMRNPLVYGMQFDQQLNDPQLIRWRTDLIKVMAKRLDEARMVRFHAPSGSLDATELGRTASHFYLSVGTVETFNEELSPTGNESDILHTLCLAAEFSNIKVREEEMEELERLHDAAPLAVRGGLASKEGKTCVLMQAYIAGLPVKAFALVSDCTFIAQSAARIARGLFEIALGRGWLSYADKVLRVSKSLEQRAWSFRHPLRQLGTLPFDVYDKLESKRATIETLRDMPAGEVGALLHNHRQAAAVKAEARRMPLVAVDVAAQPITRTVLRVSLTITADFEWVDRHHGGAESYWVWVEDTENEHIYHKELWVLTKMKKDEAHLLTFTIPLFEPLPPCYFVRVISNRWLKVETVVPLPLHELVLPSAAPAHTELLDLRPLPKSAVLDERFEDIFPFSHFNPIQTQLFHSVYHTDQNILVGSPTGSGKTVTAELSVLRMLRAHPGMKAVYVAPLKALVRERMIDWGRKFVDTLGYKLFELTGDSAPDARALNSADILATTPEKWDGVSRHWQQRGYVRQVGLVIIDEIHLLGEDRGPILEVIVSRMRYISTNTDHPVRIVGLSTAMANAHDLAEWLGIPPDGLFNFKPSVRPVPLEVHIAGFAGKHYCPRMATMNKPTYRAILNHSPEKPVLVFVSSRRQTRLTALDLIAFCSADERDSQFVNMATEALEPILSTIRDSSLRHTLAFGIGIHHAGLCESDRSTVERLFVEQSIMVLVCTSTLAWGVNFPAHLVVVKGTEFYDGKQKRYVDFPVTDVLQMMGRAGRPQFDQQGIAVILVHEPKKTFYRKFLYEPFPVESCLQEQLHDHINAEVVNGTITSKQDGIDFLTWTYFYRRLTRNPAYYHLEEASDEATAGFLSDLIEATFCDLENAGCIEIDKIDGVSVRPNTLGRVASYYYLKYTTVALFCAELHDVDAGPTDMSTLLRVLCDASEFDELPVRHNEEHVNAQMATELPWEVDKQAFDSPHVKANLLLQAYFARAALPMSDYATDTRSVLEQALRVLQAMVDIAADGGWLQTTLAVMRLAQMVTQGHFLDSSSLINLPHIDTSTEKALNKHGVFGIRALMTTSTDDLRRMLVGTLREKALQELIGVLRSLPLISLKVEPPQTKLLPGEETSVTVHLRLENKSSRRNAHAPTFPKAKMAGWWLVMGEEEELFALKRVHIDRGVATAALHFAAPEEPGEYEYTVFLVSDSYIGLDQEVHVCVTVQEEATG